MISIITPAYNSQRDITGCIESLLNQNLRDFELIIIDDCSTDRTPPIIKSYAARDGRVRFLRNERRMQQGYSRNRGTRSAAGEVLVFVDADCIADRDWLEKLVAPIVNEGQEASQGINHHSLNGSFWSKMEAIRTSQYRGLDTKNAAIKRSVFFGLGGFDSSFSPIEDVDLYRRFKEAGYRLFFSEARVRHNFSNNPFKNFNKYMGKAHASYHFLKKYDHKNGAFGLKWYITNIIKVIKRRPALHFPSNTSKGMRRISEAYTRILDLLFFAKIFLISIFQKRSYFSKTP
jgi:glycosyltransferase involved in cell wall biosynthesis